MQHCVLCQGGHSQTEVVPMLVRAPQNWTLNGVIPGVKIYPYTLKNKRVNQHLKGPRSDSVFIVLHLPYYPAGANSLKC